MNCYADALAQGVAAMRLTISDEQQNNLLNYLYLLKKWNKTYNLTALRNESQMLSHHVLDSLTLLPYLTNARSLIDVGSGGGMPGIPVAICCPDLELTLVDANSKKTTFLQQAVIELGLKNVAVRTQRVENILDKQVDIVTSRAFAALVDFVSWTRHLLNERGYWLAMKGVYPHMELCMLPEDIHVYQIDEVSVPTINAERHIVLLRPKQGEIA